MIVLIFYVLIVVCLVDVELILGFTVGGYLWLVADFVSFACYFDVDLFVGFDLFVCYVCTLVLVVA